MTSARSDRFFAALLGLLFAGAAAAEQPSRSAWDLPHMVGVVPTANVADLEDRLPPERNYYPIDDYVALLLVKLSGKTPDDYPDLDSFAVDAMVRGDIRAKPFPEVIYFKHVTDYYRRGPQLRAMLAQAVDGLDAQGRLIGVRNYVWLMLYLGDFEQVVALLTGEGLYASGLAEDGSLHFALAQAYYRLGRFADSAPHAKVAHEKLPNSVLDTRWQLMLTDLGLERRSFLDSPDPSFYTKTHIDDIFPNRSWESFPFLDVTESMGVDRWGGTGSVSFVDLDRDGWDELVWERKFFPAQIYKNREGERFDAIAAADLASPLGSPIIFTAGDLDNDGLPDLFRHCCNYDGKGPTQLLKNLGDLRFRDVTETSGLDTWGAGMVAAWGDYDLDGFLDLLIADDQGPSRLYRNTGRNSFEEVTEKAGITTPRTVGISFGDYDNDGWPDIWVMGWGSKQLYRNRGDGTFEDVTAKAGIDDARGKKGYMSFMFDYNNDGRLDLFAGQYVVSSDEKWGFGPICTCSNLLSKKGYSKREWEHATTIYRNEGDGTFTNIHETTRFIPLGMMGSNHGDWNNDGYEDLLMGCGGPFFQQAEPFLFYQNNGGDGSFELITPFEMLSLWGKGHGSAFTDFNHDGFLDVATNNGGASPGDIWPSLVLQNKGNDNHWLRVRLKAENEGTNALAVGARVTLKSGEMLQVKEVQAGGQFGAVNSLVLHFGLGANVQVDELVVRWPNAEHTTTSLRGVEADRAIEISEKSGEVEVLWSSRAVKKSADDRASLPGSP